MPSPHTEITAYVNEGDVARVAAALGALCVGERFRAVTTPGPMRFDGILVPSDCWNFALLPGAPGWTVLLAQPWNTLCRPSATGPSRFVDLCTALGVRGFMVDLVSIVPHGAMLVETDGRGLRRLSGYYYDESERQEEYYGTPLSLDDFEGTTFEVCADLACAGLFIEGPQMLDLDTCVAIAREVGGANGERLWTSGEDFSGAWSDVQVAMKDGDPLPADDGVLLQFEAATPGVVA